MMWMRNLAVRRMYSVLIKGVPSCVIRWRVVMEEIVKGDGVCVLGYTCGW